MVEAVARVMGAARRVSNQTSYGYDDDISVLAAFLSTGRQVSFNRTLRGGVKYVILGGGDQAVHDLDICVLDSNGRIIASDTAADPSPVVQFQAPITGTYTIRQTLFQGEERRGGFCVVAILREGGYDVPVANLSSAVGSLIEQCVSLDTRTKRRVSFHAEANQWAVMGGVLKQGEEITITSVALGVGDRMILAGGDSTTQDIDLYLLNSQGNRVLKDEDDDATPQLLFRSTGVGTNGLCIKNTRSRGPSLILAAFLALE